MKIRYTALQKKLDFNDIQIGDLLTFPDNPGWSNAVFMRIYNSNNHRKPNSRIGTMSMARLDGEGGPLGDAGQTYEFTRDMFLGNTNSPDGKKFLPVRVEGTLNLENTS